jgi:hypothetical protein
VVKLVFYILISLFPFARQFFIFLPYFVIQNSTLVLSEIEGFNIRYLSAAGGFMCRRHHSIPLTSNQRLSIKSAGGVIKKIPKSQKIFNFL